MYFIIFPSLFSYYIFKVYIFNNVANNHLKYYTLNVYLFQLNTFIERWLKPMALVTTKKMFEKAFEGKYAIGAFNINNMEIIQGVVSAAVAQNMIVVKTMPGLANAAASALDHMDLEHLVGTLAGDDTVLLIMDNNQSAEQLCDEIKYMLR